MELRQLEPQELMDRMLSQCGDQLRAMGEHDLADGKEVIDVEHCINGALAHARAQRGIIKKPRKNKSQKQSRRANRK